MNAFVKAVAGRMQAIKKAVDAVLWIFNVLQSSCVEDFSVADCALRRGWNLFRRWGLVEGS
jgi:hypothetical protein